MNTKISQIANTLATSVFAMYVIAYSVSHFHSLDVESRELFYYMKLLFATIMGIISLTTLKNLNINQLALMTPIIFSAVIMILSSDTVFIGFGHMIFILVIILIDKKIQNKNYMLVFILIILGLVSDLLFKSGEFIYTAHYGRERLQLGFQHPKEIANMILYIALSVLFFGIVRQLRSRVLLVLCIVPLLYYVDSRNALYTFLVFVFVNSTCRLIGPSRVVIVAFFTIAIIFIFLFWNFDEFSLSSGHRLSWWVDVVSAIWSDSTIPIYFATNAVTKFDNYLVFFAVYGGLVEAIILLLLLVFVPFLFVNKQNEYNIYFISIYSATMFNSISDFGLFSPGSLLQLLLWSSMIKMVKDK